MSSGGRFGGGGRPKNIKTVESSDVETLVADYSMWLISFGTGGNRICTYSLCTLNKRYIDVLRSYFEQNTFKRIIITVNSSTNYTLL